VAEEVVLAAEVEEAEEANFYSKYILLFLI